MLPESCANDVGYQEYNAHTTLYQLWEITLFFKIATTLPKRINLIFHHQ